MCRRQGSLSLPLPSSGLASTRLTPEHSENPGVLVHFLPLIFQDVELPKPGSLHDDLPLVRPVLYHSEESYPGRRCFPELFFESLENRLRDIKVRKPSFDHQQFHCKALHARM